MNDINTPSNDQVAGSSPIQDEARALAVREIRMWLANPQGQAVMKIFSFETQIAILSRMTQDHIDGLLGFDVDPSNPGPDGPVRLYFTDLGRLVRLPMEGNA